MRAKRLLKLDSFNHVLHCGGGAAMARLMDQPKLEYEKNGPSRSTQTWENPSCALNLWSASVTSQRLGDFQNMGRQLPFSFVTSSLPIPLCLPHQPFQKPSLTTNPCHMKACCRSFQPTHATNTCWMWQSCNCPAILELPKPCVGAARRFGMCLPMLAVTTDVSCTNWSSRSLSALKTTRDPSSKE